MSRWARIFLGLATLGAALGMVYAAVSTVDFVAHLDRQLHPLSCSLLPGIREAQQMGAEVEGCKAALFSPYSSLGRDRWWGGVPISLFGLGLYGYALALALASLLARRPFRGPGAVMLLASGTVAVATSLALLGVSLGGVGSLCTVCAGSYLGATLLLLGAALAWRADGQSAWARPAGLRTRGPSWKDLARSAGPDSWSDADASESSAGVPEAPDETPQPAEVVARDPKDPAGLAYLLLLALLGLAVALPGAVYLWKLPDFGAAVRSCGHLELPQDKHGVVLPVQRALQAAPAPAEPARPDALMVLDPLCPACRGFHQRLEASERGAGLNYDLLLLPLDTECNWMLREALHPGACLLSRALICAKAEAGGVLGWIWEQQDDLRSKSLAKDVDGIKRKVVGSFPSLAACIDAPETRIQLNRTLHYAVAAKLPVLTPQLYLDGQRLCDEDTDLGLDYALGHLGGPPAPVRSEGGQP